MAESQDQNMTFGRSRTPNEDWLSRAEYESVVEPELPIVDAHVHSWHRQGHRYFVEEYANDVRACGHVVTATVGVECGAMYRAEGPAHLRSVGETEFLAGMAAMAASRLYTNAAFASALVAFVDLTLGSCVEEALHAHAAAAQGRLRGIRQGARWDVDPAIGVAMGTGRPGLYLEPGFQEGFRAAAAMGLSFDAGVYHTQIGDVTALARKYPEATIVLVHMGAPLGYASYVGRELEVRAAWLSAMKELASCQNVVVKLGGLLMTLGNFDFLREVRPPTSERLAELWRPYLEPCIELFGAHRCMVASNFPVEKAGIPLRTIWNTFKRVASNCTDEEKSMLFHGTARRVYRMS